MEEIIIRDYNAFSDGAFIYDSWINSYFGHSSFALFIPREEYKKQHVKLIKKLLEISSIKMAVKGGDLDIIIGYIVFEKPIDTLHYLYVKEDFRGFKIARKLVEESGCSNSMRVTHLTERGRQIAKRKGYVYSPYFWV